MIKVVSCWLLFSLVTQGDEAETKMQKLAVFLIEGKSGGMTTNGTGFACSYKDQEFIATNLHVLEGASVISVKPQNGEAVQLSGNIIAAEDADICLLGILGKFSERGITPLQFMEDVFAGSKTGDEIVCIGNSLGNGVITATKGTIKAFGQPRLEIACPIVKGNSGGPILHLKSGKVVGLVTEAIINKSKFDELGVAASKSKKSQVSNISYFGHRVDTVRKWSATNLKEYAKSSQIISTATRGLERATLFLANKNGWQEDEKLSTAWKTYSKFIDQANAKDTKRVEVTDYVNEFGVVVRRDAKTKGNQVSEADFEKARETFTRAVEWKIKTDQEILKLVKPYGYRQLEARKLSLEFATQVLTMQQKL